MCFFGVAPGTNNIISIAERERNRQGRGRGRQGRAERVRPDRWPSSTWPGSPGGLLASIGKLPRLLAQIRELPKACCLKSAQMCT